LGFASSFSKKIKKYSVFFAEKQPHRRIVFTVRLLPY